MLQLHVFVEQNDGDRLYFLGKGVAMGEGLKKRDGARACLEDYLAIYEFYVLFNCHVKIGLKTLEVTMSELWSVGYL